MHFVALINVSKYSGGNEDSFSLTDYALLVFIKLDAQEWLSNNFDQYDTMFLATPDTLHKACIANSLLVLHIAQLINVDASRGDGRRRQREALTHDL